MASTPVAEVIVGTQAHRYAWMDRWAALPQTASARENGRTHGVGATADGDVVIFQQADPAVLIYDAQGQLKSQWGDRFAGAHGLTLVHDGSQRLLWLTDEHSGEVVKMTLDGQTVQQIEQPAIAHYTMGGKYSPTWVAQNEAARGGNDDIWVADGYGASLVHRFDRAGDYLGSISGEKGAGRFACPHGIAFRFDRDEPELYVADRGNRRVQVFDADGEFKRVVGAQTLHSPCCFSFHEGLTLVPELFARVDLLDENDELICTLGDNGYASTLAGWPNHNVNGRPELIEPGRFNSPHGGTFDAEGNIYIAAWIIGGRVTRLARV